jgi:adenylate kinase family enzyme
VARVHILGASGSGTTTLGRALAARLGCPHLDTDNFFWLPSEPPFERIRERPERQAQLGAALARDPAWVLSGSLCGWGDLFVPRFDVVVFVWLAPEIRLARLRERERQRYGDAAIAPGGSRAAKSLAFLVWAAAYDEGYAVERNRLMHERWLAALQCPVVRLEDAAATEEHVARIGYYLAQHHLGGLS